MSVTFTQRRPDEGFLISESNGFQSRAEITLKAGTDYDAGSVLIAEVDGSDVPTGLHVLATNALVDASPEAGLIVLARRKDARLANTKAAGIVWGAEVKDSELTVGAATTVADVVAGLALNKIIVRKAV